MNEFRYTTCDVFTDRMFGGNPLAVVTDARGIDDATMLALAREFNYSETTFVVPPSDARHTARLRIFTPGGELPFAGHPTVGTAFVLASIGATPGATDVVFEEGVGPVRVRIERSAGQVVSCTLTTAQLPQRGPRLPARSKLAAMLSLASTDLGDGAEAWSCGLPFAVVPLVSVDALQRARLDQRRWALTLASHPACKVYPVARVDDTTWQVRMFAPSVGIAEDPATGAAAAALAGWLAPRSEVANGIVRWRILQGQALNRPSEIRLEADLVDHRPAAVRVGGRCVLVAQGTIRL